MTFQFDVFPLFNFVISEIGRRIETSPLCDKELNSCLKNICFGVDLVKINLNSSMWIFHFLETERVFGCSLFIV